MKCAVCDQDLQRHEYAQPIRVLGARCWPPQLCDRCAREHQWSAGSPASLDRLTRGDIDPVEAARLLLHTREWNLPQ